MATTLESPLLEEWTLADVLTLLGGVPLERIRVVPPLGTATEQDVLDAKARTGRICELVDGILVEKTMGSYEALLAVVVARLLGNYVEEHDLGIVLGADGMLKILPERVRVPDVSFISWDRLPGRQLPKERIWALAPDLAVEILSESNTTEEMRHKLSEYFRAGTQLVWYVDPESRTAEVYRSSRQRTSLREDGVLDGGQVLPGFQLPLRELFARAQGERQP